MAQVSKAPGCVPARPVPGRSGLAEEAAAGGVDERSCDPAGLVGGEEGDDVGDLLRLADALERRQLRHPLASLGDFEDRVSVVRDTGGDPGQAGRDVDDAPSVGDQSEGPLGDEEGAPSSAAMGNARPPFTSMSAEVSCAACSLCA
jgi:hypothetical protein